MGCNLQVQIAQKEVINFKRIRAVTCAEQALQSLSKQQGLLGKFLDSRSAAGGAITIDTTLMYSKEAPLLTKSFKTKAKVPPVPQIFVSLSYWDIIPTP